MTIVKRSNPIKKPWRIT